VRVLLTGSAGFIGSYVVAELVARGYQVVGLDDFSKYGRAAAPRALDRRYRLVEGDARDPKLVYDLLEGCDHFVAGAAKVGGIGYYHTFAYDLLAANSRLVAAACDAAIRRYREGSLQKVTFLSSSMVYESARSWPAVEGQQLEMPPPRSAYGFGQLAVEYFARAARDQYGLPYTIVRPFNCVGVGEPTAPLAVEDGGSPATSSRGLGHVVPDLVHKVLRGDDPLHVLGTGEQERCFIYGGDLARGIVTAMEHPEALNEDFNLSTSEPITIRELATKIWRKIHGPDVPLRVVHDRPLVHDVMRQVASTEKAKRVLGFEAATPLDDVLDEIIAWAERAAPAAARATAAG